jgi:hypothetical protein
MEKENNAKGELNSGSVPSHSIFHSIRLVDDAVVTIAQGSERSVQLHVDEDNLSRVGINVKKEKMLISAKKWPENVPPPRIDLSIVELREVVNESPGQIRSEDSIRAESLLVVMSGSGTTVLDVAAKNIQTNLSGSGLVRLTGRAVTHTVRISGAGSVEAFELVTENTSVLSTGPGEVQVNASNKLKVKIKGLGRVMYRGRPKVKSRISGSGSLETAG